MRARARTLWTAAPGLDRRMLAYTVGDDPHWDARLLRWDVLGSLGHVEGLRAARLLSGAEHRRLRAGLRAALAAVDEVLRRGNAIAQAGVVLSAARAPAQARALLALLAGEKGRAVLARSGYALP